MQEVTVKKSDLLTELIANRLKHRDIFNKAQIGFRKEAIRQLDQALDAARSGSSFKTYFHLPIPEDHTTDYDRVIKMVKMEVEDEIDLSAKEFAQYVMDDWGWKKGFSETSSAYLAQQGGRK
jgi:hypothetical protein